MFLVLVVCVSVALGQGPVPSTAEQPPSPQGPTGSQVVHILVGHSIVIRTEARLKRVLVGNPAVISTTTTAPNEVVVTASAPGSSSLVLWHADGESRIIEIFADLDVSMLRETIQREFPGERIQVEAEEGKLVLSGTASTPAVADQIGKMASPFSKEVVNSVRLGVPPRQKQISLKVRFAEVDRQKIDALGINILSTGAANTPGAISTQQFGAPSLSGGSGGGAGRVTGVIGAPTAGTSTSLSVSDLLNIFLFRPDLNLGVTIKDLQQKNVLQILAEPNLLAISGEPARFLAGGELPYPIVQPGVGGQNTVTIQFKPFGVKLEFTGTIEADNTIRLKVAPEVSAIDYSNAVTVEGTILPAITTRHAETVVELKDGQSFGIAGLLDRRTVAALNKVPGIGDLPIIGYLFRSKSVTKSLTELLVIVTPSIVDPINAPTVAPELPKAPYAPIDPAQYDKGSSDKPSGGNK